MSAFARSWPGRASVRGSKLRQSFVLASFVTVASLGALVLFDSAQTPDPKPAIQDGDVKASVADLTWLSGDWETAPGKLQIDEHWTHVAGGTLVGTSRTIADDKTVFFEFLRIETRPGAVYYVAQPRGGSAADFYLINVDTHSATFENLAHDFPKRIVYTREGESLTARIDGGADGDGTEREKPPEFRTTRRASK